jgi:hypothetical protein
MIAILASSPCLATYDNSTHIEIKICRGVLVWYGSLAIILSAFIAGTVGRFNLLISYKVIEKTISTDRMQILVLPAWASWYSIRLALHHANDPERCRFHTTDQAR